jgi:hypothetical protein
MTSRLFKATGASLIFLGIYLNIPFSILGAIFDYPNILREPTGQVLTLFKQGGAMLIAVWYAFALAPLFLIVVSLLVNRILKENQETLLSIATVSGVLAGTFQILGLIRWVFVVPVLANAYTDANATESTRDAAVMVFNGFHQYAGVAVGEHLGQLFTALWVLLISAAMFKSSAFRNWQGMTGIAIAVLMLLGLIEGFATVINFNAGLFGVLTLISFIALSLWMISLGVTLIWQKSPKI